MTIIDKLKKTLVRMSAQITFNSEDRKLLETCIDCAIMLEKRFPITESFEGLLEVSSDPNDLPTVEGEPIGVPAFDPPEHPAMPPQVKTAEQLEWESWSDEKRRISNGIKYGAIKPDDPRYVKFHEGGYND